MVSLANVPFPYNASTMPTTTPSDLKGTWVESAFNNYKNEGTVAKVKSLIDIAAAFRTLRDIKLYCGEFGVYIPNSKKYRPMFLVQRSAKIPGRKKYRLDYLGLQGGSGLFEKGRTKTSDTMSTSLLFRL